MTTRKCATHFHLPAGTALEVL